MKKKILISAPYMHQEKEKILKMLEEFSFEADWVPVEERLEEADLLPIIAEYHGILCGDDRITPKVIDAAENLKVIVKWGTGIDSIDKAYAESKGIPVYRTPNAFTEPVADTTLGLMLNEVRNIARNHEVVKGGRWEKPHGATLQEKVIGIIGFGDIGQAVARRLVPFKSTVLVNDIKEIDLALAESLGVRIATKEEIYTECDIITLHSDLNPTSEFLLNAETFLQMKKKPYIINTARGPLIKETDLLFALEEGLISGVGIDVYEFEPLPSEHPLRVHHAVTASCHNTNSSQLFWDRVHQNSLKMMDEGLQ
jgi:D-3-phosphoglycerate dehydrogenase / 2-oxoglutarate reductase